MTKLSGLCLALCLPLSACDGCSTPVAQRPTATCIQPPADGVAMAQAVLLQVANSDADGLWEQLTETVRLGANPGDFAQTVKTLATTMRVAGGPVALEAAYAVRITGGQYEEPATCDGAEVRTGVANATLLYATFALGGEPLGRGATVTLQHDGTGWRLGGVETYETSWGGHGPDAFIERADAHNEAEDALAELASSRIANLLANRGVAVRTAARRATEARVAEVREDMPSRLWLDSTDYEVHDLKLHLTATGILPDLHYQSHGSTADPTFLPEEVAGLLRTLRVFSPGLAKDFERIRFTAHAHPSDPPSHLTRPLRDP